MTEMELANVLEVMRSLWPGTNDGDVMALNDTLRAVPTKAMAVAALKRVACQKAFKSCPRPEIFSALSGLSGGVGNRIHVYALRGDGKWTDCSFECNDTSHAQNKMGLRLDAMFDSREGFNLYIGEENFPAFSKARSEIFNRISNEKAEVRPISTPPESTQACENVSPVDEHPEIQADASSNNKVAQNASSAIIDNGRPDTLVTADKVEKMEQFRDLMTKEAGN